MEKSKTLKEFHKRMDAEGKIFTKTKTGKPCLWSELSYFETNDL